MKTDIPTLYYLFNKWEQKYPVDEWTVGEVHIWPILKKIIYFSLFRKIQNHNLKDRNKVIKYVRFFLKRNLKLIIAYHKFKTIRLKKSDYLFSGAPSHRVNWENKQFNRYFDPIMDYLESKGENTYLLEYNKIELDTVYKSKRVVNLADLLPLFTDKEKKCWNKLNPNDLPDLESFLIEVKRETGLEDQYLKEKLLKDVDSILQWSKLFKYFIKKTEAKFTFGLCYYSNAMYGMNLASSQLGLKSLDIQHGLQGFLHPAYFFNKVPSSGFNILPEYFWVWETSSYKNIVDWTQNSIHKALLGGNPWIDFINADISLNKIKRIEKPMILFTLQPLKPMLADYLIEVIKSTCKKYSWWLRLHPRMTKLEIAEIEEKLYNNKIQDQIIIKEASNLPLPFLLNNCQLHISGSSGSIAEAAMMQTPSLIIDEIGVKSFEDLIENKEAFACLIKNPAEIIELIENILNDPKIQLKKQNQKSIGYKTIIDEFIKKTEKLNN